MSAQIPTFDTVDLGDGRPSDDAAARWQEALDATPGARDGWETPEKISVAPVYTEADTACLLYTSPSPRDS